MMTTTTTTPCSSEMPIKQIIDVFSAMMRAAIEAVVDLVPADESMNDGCRLGVGNFIDTNPLRHPAECNKFLVYELMAAQSMKLI